MMGTRDRQKERQTETQKERGGVEKTDRQTKTEEDRMRTGTKTDTRDSCLIAYKRYRAGEGDRSV